MVVTFTDLKIPDLYSLFKLDFRTFSYYYPFGMEVPQTHWRSPSASKDYRYGYNSKEKDDEIYGEGNSYVMEQECIIQDWAGFLVWIRMPGWEGNIMAEPAGRGEVEQKNIDKIVGEHVSKKNSIEKLDNEKKRSIHSNCHASPKGLDEVNSQIHEEHPNK